MHTYEFRTQKRKGQRAERVLDLHFSQSFQVIPTGCDGQHRGIDRVFLGRRNGQRLTVEYKADWTASKTKNAFIETNVGSKPGWALTSEAQFLFYYVVRLSTCYVIPMSAVREALDAWKEQCREGTAQNLTYEARGLLVPLEELARIATHVVAGIQYH